MHNIYLQDHLLAYLECIDEVILAEDVSLYQSLLLTSLLSDQSVESNHVLLQ